MKKKNLILVAILSLAVLSLGACGTKEVAKKPSSNVSELPSKGEHKNPNKNDPTTQFPSKEKDDNSEKHEQPSESTDNSFGGSAPEIVIPGFDVTGPGGDAGFGVGGEVTIEIPSNETLDSVFAAVKDALGEDYHPQMPLDAQLLSDLYGVDVSNVEAMYGEVPMISANIDSFVALKATEGKVDAVKGDLENYLANQQSNAFQYPINIPVIQNAEVYVVGDYVFYICLAGDLDGIAENGDEAIANQTIETVAKVKEIIDNNLN